MGCSKSSTLLKEEVTSNKQHLDNLIFTSNTNNFTVKVDTNDENQKINDKINYDNSQKDTETNLIKQQKIEKFKTKLSSKEEIEIDEEQEEVADLIENLPESKNKFKILKKSFDPINCSQLISSRSLKNTMTDSLKMKTNLEDNSGFLSLNENELSVININNESGFSKNDESIISISSKTMCNNNSSIFNYEFGQGSPKLNSKFEVDESLTINTITVSASKFEAMHSIWVEKNKEIQFDISGVWSINASNEYIDYKGYPNKDDEVELFNEGELLCRVLGDEFFSIHKNNCLYTPLISGPLYFKMHLKQQCNPKGKLIVCVSNSIKLSFEQIDEKLGWNLNILDTTKNISNLLINTTDKNIVIMINKLRANSCLFAEQYIKGIKDFGAVTNKLYNIIKKSNTQSLDLAPLKINKQLFHFMKTLISIDCTKNEKLIKEYLQKFSFSKYYSIQTKDCSCLGILIKLLAYDDVRKAILSSNALYFSIYCSSLNSSITPIVVDGKVKSGYIIQVVFCGGYQNK